jgi:hypothetical protein
MFILYFFMILEFTLMYGLNISIYTLEKFIVLCLDLLHELGIENYLEDYRNFGFSNRLQ